MRFAVRPFAGFLAAAGCMAALVAIWPNARDAAAILASRHDPAVLSDIQLRTTARQHSADVEREIKAALAAGDVDLAQSFVDLAESLGVDVSSATLSLVDEAVAASKTTTQLARRFADGLITGDVSDAVSLSGTLLGDLFVFGDVRDAVREGKHLAFGEDVDHLVLGLSCIGLAVTAATYASVGLAAPARAGLTVIKDARRLGRLSAGLGEWAGRSMRGIVDRPLLENAVSKASLLRPAVAVNNIKAAVRLEKAGDMLAFAKDVGRVGEKAGARAAVDVLKVAESPADVARAARLAAAQGGKTRAIIKILGRGALLLAAGSFSLVSWLFAAVVAVFGFVTSVKATTERLSLAWFRRRRLRRQRGRAFAGKPPTPCASPG